MSSKTNDEEQVMHSKSDKIKVIMRMKLPMKFLNHFFLGTKLS